LQEIAGDFHAAESATAIQSGEPVAGDVHSTQWDESVVRCGPDLGEHTLDEVSGRASITLELDLDAADVDDPSTRSLT
jgi:hypothetical protein